MRIPVTDQESMYYYVVDKDTGNKIEYCIMADDVSGEYEVLVPDGEGDTGFIKTEKKTGNIQLVDTRIPGAVVCF